MKRLGWILSLSGALASCNESPSARATPPSDREPASSAAPVNMPGPSIKEVLTAAGLAVTPPEKYIYPFMSGNMGGAGSKWCACRDVEGGTSPHVGQDFATVPSDRYSFAISNGRVVGRKWSKACGWGIIFEDSQGAQWYYLHIYGDEDHPPQEIGKILRRGDLIGQHKEYPKTACGTGPHLHLERISAGKLGGEPQRKLCPQHPGVMGECGYDPATLLATKPKMLTLANAAKIAKAESNSGPIPTPVTTTLCNPDQPDIFELDPEEVVDSDAEPEGVKPLIAEIHPDFSFKKSPDGRYQFSIAPLEIEFDNGKKTTLNKCQPESDTSESCLGGVELLVQSTSGIWKRVVSDQDIRNSPYQLDFAQRRCLPSDSTRKYRFVGTTDSGRNIVVEGTFAY